MFGIEVNGIFGLIILVADIWAIIKVFESGVSTGKKVIWTVVILLLPLLGLVLWFLFGPKGKVAR